MERLKKTDIAGVIGYSAFMIAWSIVWPQAEMLSGSADVVGYFAWFSIPMNSVAMLLTLLMLALMFHKVKAISKRLAIGSTIAVSALFLLTFILLVISGSVSNAPVVQPLFSVAVVAMNFLWVLALSGEDGRAAVLSVALGGMIGLAIYWPISTSFNALGQLVLCGAIAVLASTACLVFALSQADYSASAYRAYDEARSTYPKLFISQAPDIACLVSAGAVWALLVYPTISHSPAYTVDSVSTIAGIMADAAILLLYPVWSKKKNALTVVFRLIFPVLLLILVVLPLLGSSAGVASLFVSYFATSAMSVILIVNCCNIPPQTGLKPVVAFGFLYAIYTLFLGSNIIVPMISNVAGESSIIIVAMICIYLLSFVLLVCYQSDLCARLSRSDMESTNLEHGGSDDGKPSEAPSSALVSGSSDAKSVDVLDLRKEQCEAVARQAGLSEREADVLRLIAAGGDVNYISEVLCLSVNTVQSHFKKIYAKTGVHKRQELIKLLDEGLSKGEARLGK